MNVHESGLPFRGAAERRLYVCPSCTTPEHGPLEGGAATCARCGASHTLRDRSAALQAPTTIALPDDGAARLSILRAQDGHDRRAGASVAAALGGQQVSAGEEQKALTLWQGLRARAAQGEREASEDLSVLTVLLSYNEVVKTTPDLAEALHESAFDAAVNPRQKNEQLGFLTRIALKRGDGAAGARYVSWMTPDPDDLEADSDRRVSSALVASFAGDFARVLTLLGYAKDDLPIADSLDVTATVLRANALQHLGQEPRAATVLRELPVPQALDLQRKRFPALQLCPRSPTPFAARDVVAAKARALVVLWICATLSVGGACTLLLMLGMMVMELIGDGSVDLVWVGVGVGALVILLSLGVLTFASLRRWSLLHSLQRAYS